MAAKANVKQVALGKTDKTNIYVESASGFVYRLIEAPLEGVAQRVKNIEERGRIDTRYWKKVRDKKVNALQGNRKMLTRQEVLDRYGVCPEDKSYSLTDRDGYPLRGGIPR